LFIPGGLSKICHPVEEELRSQNFYIVYSEKNKKRVIILLNLVAAKVPSSTSIYTLRLLIPGSLSIIYHPVEEVLRSQTYHKVNSENINKGS
jgi:hypothetical protein